MLLGCYRTGDANDAETYVAAVAAMLARYPEATITFVTHPVTGLPSRSQWLPTVKEIRDACEAHIEVKNGQTARDRRIAEQMAEREEVERIRAQPRPTYEELKAKYGENWGIGETEKPKPWGGQAPSWDLIIRSYQAQPNRIKTLIKLADDMRPQPPDESR